MDILAYLAFGFYVCVIIGGAWVAVSSPNLVRALVGLIATLFGVAGLYLLMQSPFLAFMQLLIYVGAVCVLVFFALMLTNAYSSGDEADPISRKKPYRSLLAGVLPLLALLPVLIAHKASMLTLPVVTPATTPLAELGRGILEDYTLPFELISIILLVAMAGAVFLAWKRRN
ncbi:MAG: NADH-quinone oxidoreductase subunit J [Deltaproteobacteria bacterium]|nr:NADH-quinone oxidoreductase subunit J [Deltaproteobacteria bacterium]